MISFHSLTLHQSLGHLLMEAVKTHGELQPLTSSLHAASPLKLSLR